MSLNCPYQCHFEAKGLIVTIAVSAVNEEKWWGLNAEFLGIRTYEMHQFYDYLHQNWRADHKNALKQSHQAAVAVINSKLLYNIFWDTLHKLYIGSQQNDWHCLINFCDFDVKTRL